MSKDKHTKGVSYKSSGVDTSAADVWTERLASITSQKGENLRKNLVSGIGDYASVYALSDKQWVACSTDGVGTKLLWTQEGYGEPEDLALDLLSMNANDLLCVGATPRLFLDYLAIGSKKLLEKGSILDRFISGLHHHCVQSGQLLVGGETAQMPDLYEENSFEVAGFSVGFLTPEEKLGPEKITLGSSIWGWPSSGPHSNGYSLLRKLFSSDEDAALIKKHFMAPTNLYVNPFLDLRAFLKETEASHVLQAAFHITGSGLLNLLRCADLGLGFDLSQWPDGDPAWVEEIKKRSQIPEAELFSTFNMGYGFLCIFSPDIGEKERSLLASKGLRYLGQVIPEKSVKIRGHLLT